MIMTLRLWSALREPRHHRHPIFQRVLSKHHYQLPMNLRILLGFGTLIGMLLFCGLSYVLSESVLVQFSFLPILTPIMLTLMVVGGLGQGLRLSFAISRAVSQERDKGTLPLRSTLRQGKLGAYWLIVTAHVHREGNLNNTNELHRKLTRLLFFISTFLLLVLYLNTWTSAALTFFINSVFVIYPLIAIYYMDYVCSVVTGALCGSLFGSLNINPLEASVLGSVTFVVSQWTAFIVTYLAATSWLPSLSASLSLGIWSARFSIASLSVLVFFLTREVAIRGLWQVLLSHLGATDTDLQEILQ